LWALSTNPNGLDCSKCLGTSASTSGPTETFRNTEDELDTAMNYLFRIRQNHWERVD
jgi:hypothetical protein